MVEAVVKLPVIMEAGVSQTGIVEAMEFYILTYLQRLELRLLSQWRLDFYSLYCGGWNYSYSFIGARVTLRVK